MRSATSLMDTAKRDATEYGYEIAADGRITRADRPSWNSRAIVAQEGRGLKVRIESSGSLLWSGPRIGNFLESFWLAEKK
ncbi:hypothetical protein ACVKU6_004179 [Stenotrophomonas sp. PvP086]|jgi:hypothetical protein